MSAEVEWAQLQVSAPSGIGFSGGASAQKRGLPFEPALTIYLTNGSTLRFTEVRDLVVRLGYRLSFIYQSDSRNVPGRAAFDLTAVAGYSVDI